ncbi:hypothetical protein OSTOST_09154, partial [Ostertagia ostertagi]
DRLGDLCDEFDDIEANYRQKLFNLIRERDQLKALLDPSTIPEVPNLRTALTEGVQMLSPETTLVSNDERSADSRVKELQKIVQQLTEENTRLAQICDDVDESESKLRRRIVELEKEISAQKVSPMKTKVTAPRLLDALQHREVDDDREEERIEAGKEPPYVSAPTSPQLLQKSLDQTEGPIEVDDDREEERIEAGKEAPYVSAPTSPQLLQKSLDQTEGPMYEESVVESAATPNRSLHTTLYKRLDKTAKLSDTPESKANTSRCAQQ